MHPNHRRNVALPFWAERYIRGYMPKLQKDVYRHLEQIVLEAGADTAELEHVQKAISRATADYFADDEVRPDLDRLQNAIADIGTDRYRPIEDVVDEFRGKIA